MISRDETMLEVLVFRYMESQRVRYDSATEQTHSVPYNLRYCNRNTRETGLWTWESSHFAALCT